MILVGLIVVTWYVQSVRPTRQIVGSVVDDVDGIGRHIANACGVTTYRGTFQPSTQNAHLITNATHYCVTTDVFGSCEAAVCELVPIDHQLRFGTLLTIVRDDGDVVGIDAGTVS